LSSEYTKFSGSYGSIPNIEQKTSSANFFFKNWRTADGHELPVATGRFMVMNIAPNDQEGQRGG
jgi:hypothetical protein